MYCKCFSEILLVVWKDIPFENYQNLFFDARLEIFVKVAQVALRSSLVVKAVTFVLGDYHELLIAIH